MNAVLSARPLQPHPIVEGWRACARLGCGSDFKPDVLSRAFCSDACAIASMYAREGRAPCPPAAPPVVKAAASTKVPVGTLALPPAARRGRTLDAATPATPDLEARYGPMREVVEEISRLAKSKTVRISCGHVRKGAPLGSKRERCPACRKPEALIAGARSADDCR